MKILHRISASYPAAAVALFCAIVLTPGVPPANAQSPYPNANLLDVAPGSGYPNGWQGVVVEGLGANASCAYSVSSIETSTVNFVNMPNNTITEISPQSNCASISQYETIIANITNYVNNHATNPGYRWGGIMLDEEAGSASDCSAQGFGFTASQLQTLNNWAYNFFLGTPGGEWWYTEDFVPQGCWNQSTYTNLVTQSQPAPQINTSYMVSLANGSGAAIQLVTWSSIYPAPYNSESASVNPITGSPWNNWGFYWANQYQNV